MRAARTGEPATSGLCLVAVFGLRVFDHLCFGCVHLLHLMPGQLCSSHACADKGVDCVQGQSAVRVMWQFVPPTSRVCMVHTPAEHKQQVSVRHNPCAADAGSSTPGSHLHYGRPPHPHRFGVCWSACAGLCIRQSKRFCCSHAHCMHFAAIVQDRTQQAADMQPHVIAAAAAA